MFTINDDLSIHATRGDTVFFTVTAEENGVPYYFEAGDVLRMKIFGKKDAESVVLEKCFPVTARTDRFTILLTEEDTKIGDVISKPRDYWYEIELNPFTNPQTIIGYDEDGPKVFKLFPEGKDSEVVNPEPRVIAAMDDELDMTSTRPVQNQAIARAIVNIAAACKVTEQELAEKTNDIANTIANIGVEIATERSRIDGFTALKEGSTTGDAELIDGRTDHEGKKHTNIGGHIREITGNLSKSLARLSPLCRGNLYDKTTSLVDGYYIQTETGAYEEYSAAKYALIPLGNSAEYVFSKTFGTVLLLDDDKNTVKTLLNYNESSDGEHKTLTNISGESISCVVLKDIPATAKFVAVNIRLNDNLDYQDNFYFGTEADYVSGAEECFSICGRGMEDTKAREMLKNLTNVGGVSSVLHGKVLATVGDSLTEGINPNGGYFDTYGKITADRHGMTFLNYGVSGSTMQDIAGHDGFSNPARYQNMADHIDYMTIWFGWNDHAYGVVGTNSDTDAAVSFYGGWHTVIPYLLDKYPTTKIGLIVPYGANDAYRKAVRDIAQFYGLGLLDLYDESGRIPMLWGNNKWNGSVQEKRRATFTYDGCHLNQDGHNYLNSIYEHFLLSL